MRSPTVSPKPALLTEAGALAVIAAGGTGGHLFPAQALAEALIARGWRIALATDRRTEGLAESFPAEQKIAIASATFAGGPAARAAQFIAILRGVMEARATLEALGPKVVVGFGGYPSIPTLIAARTLGLRTVIHEANAVMGRANRLLAPAVTEVACAFPTLMNAAPSVKARAVVVGSPVRPAIRALAGQGYTPPTADGPLRLFVTGGSQGARILSSMVPEAVALLPRGLRSRLEVVQQTRAETFEAAEAIYRGAGVRAELAPFFADMAARWTWAHLAISRAGASTVSEIAVAGRPAILVPLGVALDDDQGQNARLLAEAGAAEVFREGDLTADILAGAMADLLADPERLTRMAAAAASVAKPDAAEHLADLVERAAA
ncbi:MAG TPA: undecaprenyldiphospho-muramoylpentapeptide beta-N-acetylglucosaminyltransferase [Caulobacteraceae bacterium]